MRPYAKFWKESASLLILGRSPRAKPFNYEVLVLKRSAKASFMPNGIVFPGGTLEDSDSSHEWLSLYRDLGVSDARIAQLSQISGQRSFIFERERPTDLAREISLRIGAIRETFEEVGVLFAKNAQQFAMESPLADAVTGFDVKEWQKIVHGDHKEFIRLCRELNVAPDIFGAYESANWLTPTTFGKKRFNTAFFFVALPDQPQITAEDNEVQSSRWETPESILDRSRNREYFLPPPQHYELSKISHKKDIDDLAAFMRDRQKHGLTLIFPYQFYLADAVLDVYPGDSLYPAEPSYTEITHDKDQYKDKTLDEMRKLFPKHHRNELLGDHSRIRCNMLVNIPPTNGHLCPVQGGARAKL
ncbi:acyl-coenzyme A diphosphatase NUDT19-like [Phlebotomus argentipes]|uniref:acyl-coenzyme A diphosphatase NUDT19-like n=1 Tax=Phlebotomus argentipes TaxID=94469 RepID=UPI0028938020|nr:acyl-coenzyme A diphosphatase NUDT19-like [Phlebotomus argentipes]XP_059615364.1 acyl-coenzyme A diphosphatase NUDT19-like [Phlebotomus argentipes]XP_059615365.1 acyl-coenzyme A diphosphatase NUDT19-like [Phlebotomus argentipes]